MDETARRAPLPPARRVLFVVGACFFAWGAIELAAMALHLVANGHVYPKSTIKREMKAQVRGLPGSLPVPVDGAGLAWNADGNGIVDLIEVIHPYLGFVLDRDRNVPGISDQGFIATSVPDVSLPRRGPDQLVVGVFGGSFASGVADRVPAVLEACPNLDGRRVLLRRIALGGYKQPQQVMALAYLTMLGAEFDLVIGIDGFNEVALPLSENVAHGVHPHHPRMWHLRASTVLGPERARAVGRVEVYRDARARWAGLFYDDKLYRSPALSLLWQAIDAAISRQGRVEEDRLAAAWPEGPPAVLRGPPWPAADSTAEVAMGELADHWARAALQMRALAEANGARYLHVLQPNQYVDGSKPMGAEERARAIGAGPFADAVRLGYPMLVARSPALRAAGLHLIDATGVYAEVEEPIYIDDCCHVTAEGYERVAQAICDAL